MNISKEDEFLEKLARLCEEYGATIDSDADTDIIISLNEEEIFRGQLWIDTFDALRDRKNRCPLNILT